jgi:hypothetical protein
MNPKFFRVARRIIIFMMICYLGNILWKNHTAPHYVTPSGSSQSVDTQRTKSDGSPRAKSDDTQSAK